MNASPMNASTAPAYAEFAVQSNFSFLRGASQPEDLVVTAARHGLSAIGLADCNTVAGTVRAWKMAEQAGLAYHPGSRLVFADGTPDILAYPRDRQGWAHLCRMLTAANMREESRKGAPLLYRSDLLEWGGHMSLAAMVDCARPAPETLDLLAMLKERFGKTVRVAAAPLRNGGDRFALAQAADLAEAAGLPLMAVGEVLYHVPERRPLQDLVTAIRLKTTVAEAGFSLNANAERHMKSPARMASLFRSHPEALSETLRFASELEFSLSQLEYNYPDEPTESGLPPQEELERLTWEGADGRFPGGVPGRIEGIIRHELDTVRELNYARYFLTVHDIVTFARSKGILCQGRGSAANSLICYCLGITDVGPDIVDTLFERFISRERNEPPDIDVDFEHERREEVIAYIYERYSGKRTALAASVVTYRARSALRETAKALGLSEDTMSALSGSIWGWSSSQLGQKEAEAAGLAPADPVTKQVLKLANEIMGFPRHLSQHVGGFVITRDRLDEMVPIVRTAMDERKMVEWDKDDLDAVKMLKVDVLALGMLSCLRRCFDLMKDRYGRELTLATLPPQEPAVYDMICRADTLGTFQIESRAQMSMLPRLKPRTFYDLVIEVAIVRPGPIQGDMVHPYLRRREKKEKVEYQSEELKGILKRTLGVPLFQEQAMRIAIVAGGFTPGEADELRRAMATFRRVGTIGNYRDRMISGMAARGYPREFAERCFRQIEGFGEYGFPESHAASFALLVYASCWFKAFYPDVFCAAILNSQPMGFYAPAQLVRDAREHGVEIRPVDVNHSGHDCTLEPGSFDPSRVADRHGEMRSVILSAHAVRLGLRLVKGVTQDDMKLLVERRGGGYRSVRDLWLRTGLSRAVIIRLAEADAFRSLGLDRRAALWAARALDGRSAAERLPLFERPRLSLREQEPQTHLPQMPLGEHVIHDYRTLSLSLKAHPVSFLRRHLDAQNVTSNGRLHLVPDGTQLSVAGLVLVRQRPGSAKGIVFMTMEDEEGIANAIFKKNVMARFRPIVMGAALVRVDGRLQSHSGVIHVVARHITDLTPLLAQLSEHAFRTARSAEETAGRTAGPGGAPFLPADTLEALAQETGKVMPKGRNFH